MIEISPTLTIDEREIQETFVRAEGPERLRITSARCTADATTLK